VHEHDEVEVLSPITHIEIIAQGSGIRDLALLRKTYGGRRWRKLKGFPVVRNRAGDEFDAEIHYYECHGIGRRRVTAKRKLE
jgi:hypothetical protein